MSISECAAYKAGQESSNREQFEDVFDCEAFADDNYPNGFDSCYFVEGWEDANVGIVRETCNA